MASQNHQAEEHEKKPRQQRKWKIPKDVASPKQENKDHELRFPHLKKRKIKTARCWWCTPLIPALGRQRQISEFEASLDTLNLKNLLFASYKVSAGRPVSAGFHCALLQSYVLLHLPLRLLNQLLLGACSFCNRIQSFRKHCLRLLLRTETVTFIHIPLAKQNHTFIPTSSMLENILGPFCRRKSKSGGQTGVHRIPVKKRHKREQYVS